MHKLPDLSSASKGTDRQWALTRLDSARRRKKKADSMVTSRSGQTRADFEDGSVSSSRGAAPERHSTLPDANAMPVIVRGEQRWEELFDEQPDATPSLPPKPVPSNLPFAAPPPPHAHSHQDPHAHQVHVQPSSARSAIAQAFIPPSPDIANGAPSPSPPSPLSPFHPPPSPGGRGSLGLDEARFAVPQQHPGRSPAMGRSPGQQQPQPQANRLSAHSIASPSPVTPESGMSPGAPQHALSLESSDEDEEDEPAPPMHFPSPRRAGQDADGDALEQPHAPAPAPLRQASGHLGTMGLGARQDPSDPNARTINLASLPTNALRSNSNDSFSLLSPHTQANVASKNLGVAGRLVRLVLGHSEKDRFAHVTEKYQVKKSWVYQDMSLPLSHYFISSGHNSYLVGNQFTSNSGVKPITDSLDGGCRVIELDVWSGKKEPKVLHGFTMTKPVSFHKCIKGIRKHAFRSSDFPLIITLENHCNEKNKRWLVRILLDELGALIHRSPQPWTTFPSPESLCRRILIRDKNDADQEILDHNHDVDNGVLPPESARQWEALRREEEHDRRPDSEGTRQLQALITIINQKHRDAVRNPHAASSSRGEGHFDEMLTNWADTVKHTQRQLLRTYPAAKRVDSSNHDPFVPWSFGAQVVAMNWQTPGLAMTVYRGMFGDNGGCGYLKKPDYLLASTPVDANTREASKIVSVRVLSARHLHHRTIKENYVSVQLVGLPKDRCERRTKSVKGFNCCTFDEELLFGLRCPELAVLLFTMYADDLVSKEVFCGQVCIPLNNISEGKFEIPLLTRECKRFRGLRRHRSVVVDLGVKNATGNLRRLIEGL